MRSWGGGPDEEGAGGGGGDDSGLADTAGDEYLLYVLGFRGSGIRLKTQVDECYPLLNSLVSKERAQVQVIFLGHINFFFFVVHI